MHKLAIKNLSARVEGKRVLDGVSLSVKSGEVHAIMGPNGSGKSTLSHVVMGNPVFEVTGGDILFDGKSVLGLSPDERARLGLFLGFQNPLEIPGVSLSSFLRTAFNLRLSREAQLSPVKFNALLQEEMASLGVPPGFSERGVNEGFSGGEKKRCEILQLALLKPKFAILDEMDSGLDVDALKTVAQAASRLAEKNGMGVVLVTHYARILRYMTPDFVHVFVGGKIRESGGPELAAILEEKGYAKYSGLDVLA